MPTKTRRRWMSLPLLAALPGAAAAVEPLDTVNFSVGSYISRFDTQVRADGEFSQGSRIDLKHDLGLDPEDLLAFGRLSWRPFDRHEFGLSYFGNNIAIEHRLERDISFEGEVYAAGATVRAGYDLDSYEAYYVWWAFSEENWALGPRLGVSVYRLELALDLELDVNGNPIGGGGIEGAFRGDLPAPTLGGGWRWTPHEDWRVSADLGWLDTTINRIEGTVAYGRVGVEWHPWRNAGVMLDYNYSDIRARTEREHFTGRLNLRNSGLRLGLVFRY